ncbi:uncharacterized protein LOC121048063 [Ixodes scapularis]|uniref:uncharacterized protein LOC121048063 n=1 Tax=Ixodes scapularis TaxID=6945 RepID=UPI001AD6F01F|nr:uncharacterized protein LOC121048063 [Ixodes scapularis]
MNHFYLCPFILIIARCIRPQDIRLTTSNPQVLSGVVTKYTCSAPFSADPSFRWYVDNEHVNTTAASALSIQVSGLSVERTLDTEALAYSVLEIRAYQPKTGIVTCSVFIRGTGLTVSSAYVVTSEDDLLHASYNSSCTRDTVCVDGNSSCSVDLRTRVSKCLCKRGYRHYSQLRANCAAHYGGIGSPCSSNQDCLEWDRNAHCHNRRCSCKSPFSNEYRIGKCIKEVSLFGACSGEFMCLVEHSYCANHTCQCFPGRVYDGNKCSLLREGEGLNFKKLFLIGLVIFSAITLLPMVIMATIRAVFTLMPLHQGSRGRRRRIIIRLL